jgi:hypothetical protein
VILIVESGPGGILIRGADGKPLHDAPREANGNTVAVEIDPHRIDAAFYADAREDIAKKLEAIPLDDLRLAGHQADNYHEDMRALFVRVARGQ